MIIKRTVDSRAIAKYSYDTATHELAITFTSSDTAYDYPNVPQKIVEDWAAAPSVGKYFNTYIKQYAKTLY